MNEKRVIVYQLVLTMLSFLLLIFLTSTLAGMGLIDLEYLDQEIENDNPLVIYPIVAIFIGGSVIMGALLTRMKLERVQKVENDEDHD